MSLSREIEKLYDRLTRQSSWCPSSTNITSTYTIRTGSPRSDPDADIHTTVSDGRDNSSDSWQTGVKLPCEAHPDTYLVLEQSYQILIYGLLRRLQSLEAHLGWWQY